MDNQTINTKNIPVLTEVVTQQSVELQFRTNMIDGIDDSKLCPQFNHEVYLLDIFNRENK